MAIDHFKVDKGLNLTPRPAAPASPTNGDVYYDSPTQRFKFYQNGLWKNLGSGGGGNGINYIQLDPLITPDFEDNTTAGWATYANSVASTVPELSPGGTPNVNFTFTVTNSQPLRDLYSGLITKDAANRQGHGVRTSTFNVDRADFGKTLFVSFDFESSGSYIAGDMKAYITDGTSILTLDTLDVPQGRSNFRASFTASNSSTYKLYFHVATTSALAYTMKIDNISVGPDERITAAAIGDWVLTTTTAVDSVSGIARSLGSGGSTTMYMRRVGDSVQLKGQVQSTGSGRYAGGETVSITMPPGLVIDSTKDYTSQGLCKFGSIGPNIFQYGNVQTNSTTNRIDFDETDGNGYTGFTWARLAAPTTSGQLVFEVTAPVVNWDSNVVLKTGREEFAFNTGSNTGAGTSDLVNFGNGAAGTPFLAYNSTTATPSSTDFRVRFQTPIQPTDVLMLEIQEGSGRPWESSNMGAPYSYANTTPYGMRIDPVSGSFTDMTVSFMNGGKSASAAATYGAANGDPWSGVASAGWRWRLRKAAGPTAVEATSSDSAIAVTDWQTYTPDYGINGGTGFTLGTGGTSQGMWRRVGDSMECMVTLEAGTSPNPGTPVSDTVNYYVKIPTGYNIDATKLMGGATSLNNIGHVYVVDTTFNTYSGTAQPLASVTNAIVGILDSEPNLIGTNRPSANWWSASGDRMEFRFTVPISNWDSVVKIQDGREEFAYNSSVTTTTDSTSFGYGPTGVVFQAFAPTGVSNITKRVRFTNPIQDSDVLTLETLTSGNPQGPWIDLADRIGSFGFNDAGTQAFGAHIKVVPGSTTDIDVTFYSNASQLGGGEPWSGFAAASPPWRWRVRKAAGPNIVQANPGYLAAISTWQVYVPTITGFGTVSATNVQWRQVGDTIHIHGNFTIGTPTATLASITLPLGYFPDFTKMPGLQQNRVGMSERVSAASSYPSSNYGSYPMITEGFGNLIYWSIGGGASNLYGRANGNQVSTTAGELMAFQFEVPVIGLSANVNVQNANEEFAFNTGSVTSAGGSDLTSFGYGPDGTLIKAVNSTQTTPSNTVYRVRFTTPIQDTDIITVELFEATRPPWVALQAHGFETRIHNSTFYGITLAGITSAPNTDIDVAFGNGGARAYNAATYGAANGDPWSGYTTWKWRVRKVAAPGLVALQTDEARSGIYTPVMVNISNSNVSTPTINTFQWHRIGRIVFISGSYQVQNLVGTGAHSFTFTLPINGTTNVTVRGGLVIGDGNSNGAVGVAQGNASSTLFRVDVRNGNTGGAGYNISLSYHLDGL